MPASVSSWKSAIDMSCRYGTFVDTHITGSGDNLLQNIKIRVDDRTSATPTLGLLHKHYDSAKGDLRGVVPESVPLKPRLIKMLGCDRVLITNRVNDGTRIGIKYLGLNSHREEVEKASDSIALQKNQFKYTFRDSYSGQEVVGTKTFSYEPEEPAAPPVTAAPRRSDTQRLSSRRNDVGAPKTVPTKRATMPTPTRTKATSSHRPESANTLKRQSAGFNRGDFADNFYIDGQGIPRPISKSNTMAPNVEDMYSYGEPGDFLDDDTLKAMGILSMDEPKPRTMPDEKQARSMSYSNSRLEAESKGKQKVTYPADVQEVLDKHRQMKVEGAKVVLEAQLRDALARVKRTSSKNLDILNSRLDKFAGQIKTAETAKRDADRKCRNARSSSDKAYITGIAAWDKAKQDIQDYQFQYDRILTQIKNASSNSEIGPIQDDLKVINDYINSLKQG
ncbi:MAG TPA: hypothetical protein DHW71_10005 [Gammaproteobacteria bacterium]|nr:hypothetical protein [Gammaproteobacteria bacterium]HBF08663.1 hypothetical protein [Gammaproteobacteria bacterium]HCK93311.1 hypothetical protein [Gammaproteobacteria bacterium]|tara:strand:- start:51806 stop:53152 length:1347 start_codon:yes stop_codon:yes gene_type:complete